MKKEKVFTHGEPQRSSDEKVKKKANKIKKSDLKNEEFWEEVSQSFSGKAKLSKWNDFFVKIKKSKHKMFQKKVACQLK